MKKVFKKIISAIKNFFNRMADQEAERVIRYYSQIFEDKSNNNTRPYRMGRCPLLWKEVDY